MQKPKYIGELSAEALVQLRAKGTVERIEKDNGDETISVSYLVYIGQLTNEQIAKYKLEHGEDRVFVLEVPTGNNEISVSYFRKANRTHIARAMSLILNDKPVEAGESILGDTFLDGDKRVLSLEDKDTDLHIGVAWFLYQNTKILEAKLKNA